MKNKEIKKIYSDEHIQYIKNVKRENLKIKGLQLAILMIFIFAWEFLAHFKLIDSFITSSPSRVLKTIVSLHFKGQLWNNILITFFETFVGFLIGTVLGIIIAALIWYFQKAFRVLEPYLSILNALPKVALGPILIVWMGASISTIILMALLVSFIIAIMNILQGFESVDNNQILLMKSFGAKRLQIFFKLVFPSSISSIISALKINVGMSLIGVITGEFLVSNGGIGYLIVYAGQVFNMDLVISGVVILAVLAWGIYGLVSKFESIYSKR